MEGVGLLFANSKVSASTFFILVLTDAHLLSLFSTNLNILILSYFSYFLFIFLLVFKEHFLFPRSLLTFTIPLFFSDTVFYYKLEETRLIMNKFMLKK
jgi:hypothetical protein